MMYKAIPIGLLLLTLPLKAQDDFQRFNAKPERVEPQNEDPNPQAAPPPGGINIDVNGEQRTVTPPDTRNSSSRNKNRNNFRARETNKLTGAEEKTFGRESLEAQRKNEQKYVNLNPETAFGPEIIESFDFPNTDILEITKHMQKLTGINLILDKDVKGKVSISAPTPITVGDAWKAYLVALNMAGYSLIKTGEFYRIINSRDIRYTPTKIYTGDYIPDVENYMMKIIALKHVDASEIVRNFRPFMSRYGRILDINQTNTIIITDTGTNINRLIKLVDFLDVPGFEEAMQIIPVKHTSAQELAKLLDSILKDDRSSSRSSRRRSRTSSSGSSSNTGPNISKIIAEPRTNSIIAMANAAGTKQLKELITKLDVQTVSSGSGKIQVYYLQYGDAEDLSKTLTSLISSAKTSSPSSSSRSRRSSLRSRLTGGSDDDSESIFSDDVKVTADKATNSLVVTASPTDWLTVKQVIKKLDIPRDQVYVEGLIMETKIDSNRELGTNYAGLYGDGIAEKVGFGAGSVISLNDLEKLGAVNGFFAGFGIGSKETFDMGGVDITASPINAIIKATAANGNNNILATPQLLVMDNTEGIFEVGSKVPVQKQTTGAGGVTSTGFDMQDVTMKIKITPQINKVTRFIKLKIDQSISDFSTSSTASTPASGGVATDVRNAVTEVVVRDRDTIAMGGLLRDKYTDQENKIPLLGDIPILGWLFKNKTKTKEKINVLFFLTPKIISPYEKVASQNTLDVINKRNQGIKDTEMRKDLYSKEVSELTDKVEKQTRGPLYSQEQAALYQNEDVAAPESLTIEDVEGDSASEDEYSDFLDEEEL